MKLLFLDIDGVMNTEHGLKTISENWTNLEKIHRIGGQVPFCPEAIKSLKKIVDETGAKLVITSTWAGGKNGLKKMLKLWEERNLPGEVIDVTKHESHGIRGEEIDNYLKRKGYYYPKEYWNAPAWEENREKCEIEGYCIVDDEWDFFILQQPHFVNTPAYYGLAGEGKAEEVIKCLNIKPE